ncbi:archease [Methanobacterium alcaliphilum]|uniref:archease n=1 Tax=Methanobacterium alcaliphilum TaxID=392018 RepID=UPI00200AF2C3|nr:archease [Methanobacterium alcaliphilum]MCK9152570.1 archease [Methanobacterium alcaliphilum]
MQKKKQNSIYPSKKDLKFEFFDVTADTGFWAYGSTLEESFENAGLAMFEVMTDTNRITPQDKKYVNVESEDLVSLLYDWLEELLFLHDVEFIVFSKFKVEINKVNNGYSLKGIIIGEKIDKNRHEQRSEVKAVTFHLMEVKEENGYMVRAILDL